MSALVAALAASVEHPHWSPYDLATRHTVWIDEQGHDFVVHCIPHGEVGVEPTFLAAMLRGYAHDEEQGEVSW